MTQREKEKLISFERLEQFKNNLENTYGKPLGLAQLDDEGGILESQLPWAAFNVKEYADKTLFPAEGKPMRLYIDLSTNSLYRWDEENSEYINTSSPESVTYTPQTRTEEEKAQARANIGAMAEADLPSYESVLYVPQSLETEQKTQARTNIDAASTADMANLNVTVSGMSSTISQLEAAVRTLGDNVSDVTLVDEGLKIDYANGTSKIIEIDYEMPIKSVVYDDSYQLHFLDENGDDYFDPITIQGGGGSAVGTIAIKRDGNESFNCVYGGSAPISYTLTATDAQGDDATINSSYWSVGGIIVVRNVPASQGKNTFDIGPYLNQGSNTVKLFVSASTGGQTDQIATKTWKVNAVNMRIEWDYDDTRILTSDYTDVWTVYGDIEKTSHTLFNGVELDTTTTSKSGATQSIVIEAQPHGVYGIEHWLTAYINSKEGDVDEDGNEIPPESTEHIYHEMIFAQYGMMDPLISISKKPFTMDQYNTVRIPVFVYDPESVQTDVTLLVDDEEVTTWENVDRTTQYWSYTPTTSGVHVLTVRCRDAERSIAVTVREIELDIEEVAGYTFKFKASDFASNNAVKTWESNGITAEFSENFDWINGGLHTETDNAGNLQQYFCIKAGTRMTIKHKPFLTDPKGSGMTFKMIFKHTNCRDYDAEIAHCYANVGIRFFAHEAVFNSSGHAISVPYSEDDYLELEFDVYPQPANESDTGKYRYMMAWLDGVITSCRIYDSTDNFTQTSDTAENIVIGSDDSDVYVYLVKYYPRLVNRDGHINNFIMDAPNASEMSKRYDRNNILEGSEISYEKLAQKNPDLRVWTYEIPYLTNNKSDKVTGCKFGQLWTNGDNYYRMSGVGTMSVQGTSSVDYIRGAANTDINFTELRDGNGVDLLAGATKDSAYGNNWFVEDSENPKHAKVFDAAPGEVLGPECVAIERDENRNVTKYIKAVGMKLNDDSCPITYSNTKVNFASCEQVNNMCNAVWYQRYNPYPSLTARDCMEFNMGVQFIADTGDIPDANHFVLFGDRKLHMYSIANMGTSKKNIHIFHDLSNPKECCIEVKNNTNEMCRMITAEGFDDIDWSGDIEGADHSFEMRYPSVDTPSEEMRLAWKRFVTWMAESNPKAATGNQLSSAETYSEYVFRGHDRGGTQVLRGTRVTQYAGTYTHDTFERRMAKMLSECEDYMVMDSVIYHFVFLERHTMVDNVSKNNFWSSADLIHWDVSKAYDMDTSDGNNNDGQLVFDYGNEYNDVVGAKNVFNSSDSVWFQFAANLYEACRTMFINRESIGAWSATAYHEFLLSEQRKVPERCWVQCYWYDYLRPYEQNNNQAWMAFLDGGQKTHQRKHYETYEEAYDSSKYRGIASTSDNITLRCYSPASWSCYISSTDGAQVRATASTSGRILKTIPNGTIVTVSRFSNNKSWRAITYDGSSGYISVSQLGGISPKNEISLKMYNKMYIIIDLDGNIKSLKAEKGQTYTIDFSEFGLLNDTVFNIRTARMVQEIDGVAQLYPGFGNFSSGIKLRSLAIGSDEAGYSNPNLDQQVALGNNKMLEWLYVQNLPNINSPLNLENCPALRYLDASGSSFTGYSFASGGLIETAILENPTSLRMLNLNYLLNENFSIADYSRLVSIHLENVPGVNTLNLVTNATALQIVRMLGIAWTLSGTSLLNKMLKMQGMDENNNTIQQSVLTGSAYVPAITQRIRDEYQDAWPNLDVTYARIITEYEITFVNPDGSYITDRSGNRYIQYVDEGKTVQDPVANGDIETPTMESTQQYTYTFTGWQNITGAVNANRTVTATYDSAVRYYRVRWFSQDDVILKTADVAYGTEVVYEDSTHAFPPTKAEDEESFYYSVFTGWDKSTGFIAEDTDVYAVWQSDYLPPTKYVNPTDPNSGLNPDYVPLNELRTAQIYAISKSLAASNYWDLEDYTDIKVGKDFNFSNVESAVLAEDLYFNGSTFRDTGIQLFSADAPTFTLAIDYEFAATTVDSTLVACYNGSGSEGFRISCRSDNPAIIWGDKTNAIGNYGMKRSIVVLMHLKGSKNLYVVSNNNGSTVYGSSLFEIELVRTQETTTTSTLVFGGAASINGQIAYPGKGIIHWCKIWYANLGKNVIKQIANWPRETWRMKYAGSNRYYPTENTGFPVSATFIANAPLSNYMTFNSTSGSNTAGWDETESFNFVNTRCFDALPYEWQQIVKRVNLPMTKFATTYTPTTTTVPAKIYLPAIIDVNESMATNQYEYSHEGTTIRWFNDAESRLFFSGLIIPEDAQYIRSNSDPTASSVMYTVHEGDIWIHTNNNSRGYIYVSAENAEKHGYFGAIAKTDTTNIIEAVGGGLWVSASSVWTRSRAANYNNYYYAIPNTGFASSSSYEYASGSRALLLMFSI